ncbi:preprotein translocase subunit SecG [Brevirhabdus sp.]|uniref:preprotein translocase subunit SecG n=1 Tax=Brevirhabdus sp. TaxID=2004514 RepID=UPI004059F557
MENVVLVIHLLLALSLIGVVLLQRSEGGGLGMGGGGGGGGVMSSRAAATALGKITWGLAIGFIATSITLTIFAAQNSAGQSLVDRLGVPTTESPVQIPDPTPAPNPLGDNLLPPSASDAPSTPPRAE